MSAWFKLHDFLFCQPDSSLHNEETEADRWSPSYRQWQVRRILCRPCSKGCAWSWLWLRVPDGKRWRLRFEACEWFVEWYGRRTNKAGMLQESDFSFFFLSYHHYHHHHHHLSWVSLAISPDRLLLVGPLNYIQCPHRFDVSHRENVAYEFVLTFPAVPSIFILLPWFKSKSTSVMVSTDMVDFFPFFLINLFYFLCEAIFFHLILLVFVSLSYMHSVKILKNICIIKSFQSCLQKCHFTFSFFFVLFFVFCFFLLDYLFCFVLF